MAEPYKEMFPYIPYESFESYSERLKEHFKFKREGGIIEVRMHHNDGEALWGLDLHRAVAQMFVAVGQDRDNEILILTGTGEGWLRSFGPSFVAQERSDEIFKATNYDQWYVDATRLIEAPLYNIDIPIVAAINGPGFHTEFALLSDIVICSDDAVFFEGHMDVGLVPGDGLTVVLLELLGLKRGAGLALLGQFVTAQEALTLGLVNEVHSRDKLLPRAWEIARRIMTFDRVQRNFAHSIIMRKWKRIMLDDLQAGLALEMYAINTRPERVRHSDHEGDETIREAMKKR